MSALFDRYMRVVSSAKTKKWEMGHPNKHDTYEFTHVSQPAGVSTSMLLFVFECEKPYGTRYRQKKPSAV